MAGRVPEGWRGSNLKTRTEVVRFLQTRGGELRDDAGGAAKQLEVALGQGRAFGEILRGMERDGMIEREVKGRRTYAVRLIDSWGLSDRRASGAHLPEVFNPVSFVEVPGALTGASFDGVDYDELAETLLRAVVAKATAPAPGSREVREAARRAEVAERNQRDLEVKLRETNERLRAADEQADEMRRLALTLEHNLEAARSELASPGRRRGGQTVSEALTAEQRAALDQLASRVGARSKKAG